MKHKVAILGSGNWGSAIAKVVGQNVRQHPELFEDEVRMYVYEELVDGERYLTSIINTNHENVKYLPGVKLPDNIVADPDPIRTAEDATLLIFVLPHQFVNSLCHKLKGKLHHRAKAISLIKGMAFNEKGPVLISSIIEDILGIDVSVLCGANIAKDVAWEHFSETTVGYKDKEVAQVWKQVFHSPSFNVGLVEDIAGVELCGALKNIIAVGLGMADGLGAGANTKAAIMRIGLAEMRRFAETFFKGVKQETFFESCGVADLIVTCFFGRNRKVAAAFVKQKKSFEQLEKEMLHGQKLQGTLTAQEVNTILKRANLTHRFPLMTTIYEVCFEKKDPHSLTDSGIASPHVPASL